MSQISDDPPKISIIVPSFNQGRFLEETLNSILNQNYPNLELIVLDAGSSDESVNIIRKYEKYIKYWRSHPDDGQTFALIEGFELSTGDILGWINSDDVLISGTLKKISNIFKVDPDTAVYFGHYLYIDSDGFITEAKKVSKKFINWFARRGMWIFGSTGTFFSRNAYEIVGGLNNELEFVMDSDLFMRMILANLKYKHLERYVGGFRRHGLAKTVCSPKKSKKEHDYAAKKYWPKGLARLKKKKSTRILYLLMQVLNGNFLMKVETIKFRGKMWKAVQ